MVNCLADLVRSKASSNSSKIALSSLSYSISYSELQSRSNQLAQMLIADGVELGDRVVFLARNRSEYFDVLFAVAKIGAIIVPINWRLTEYEMTEVLLDAQPRFVFLDPEFSHLVESLRCQIDRLSTCIFCDTVDQWQNELSKFYDIDPNVEVEPDSVMCLIYTSGTTGKPKGVMLTHHNFFSVAEKLADAWHFEPNCTVYVPYPVFHAAGTFWPLLTMLRNGKVIFRSGFDEVDFINSVEREGVNLTLMVPTVINMVLSHPMSGSANLQSLKNVIYGVSPISQTILENAISRLPNCSFHHAYGLTEATGMVTTMQWSDHRPGTERMKSCGKPFDWVQMRIVDPKTRCQLGPREVGEVAVRSASVMKGYFKKQKETRDVLDEDNWLYTGDGGFVDEEGFLFITDRIKDMIISGGENIYPAEIENVLFAIDGVKEAAVIGVPDEIWGESVHAIIVLNDGAKLDHDKVIEFCQNRIAKYKCPKSVEFRSSSLPLNPTGKVLKRELRDSHHAQSEAGA